MHLSTPFFYIKMAQRSIISFFSSPSGNKRLRPSETDNDNLLHSFSSTTGPDSDSASDSEFDDHEAAVPVSLTLHTSDNLVGSVSSSTVTDSVCDAECCQMMTGKPYQPPDSVLSCKRIQGQQNRYFQQSWFADHSWVSYCITLHKAF